MELNPMWNLPESFIEKTDKDELLLYADTDSAYLLYDLPFDKFDDIYQLVDYVQGIARELSQLYNDGLEHYLCNFAGLNKKYNTMDFKSEVIAYRGFFNTKKFYGLGKAWDEGTFFENEPKLKTVGGQIKKSDVTELTKELLTEVYEAIVLDNDANDPSKIYRKIFIQLKNKYKLKISEDIKNMDFRSFSIPKKWGSTEKTIPPFVTGAKLYNSLVDDTFRPSDAFIVVKIKVDIHKLLQFFDENPIPLDKYLLQKHEAEELGSKINVISIPPVMDNNLKDKLLKRMKDFGITLDFAEIVNYNIDLKLDPFLKLFDKRLQLQG